MNSHPLNGAAFNSTISYATSAGLAGEVDMIFVVSEQNNAPINGSISMQFTVAGQLSSAAILSAPPITMTFGVNGDGLFNNTYLIGTTGIAFAPSGTMNGLIPMSVTEAMTLDATGSLTMVGHLNGEVDVVFSANGTPSAMRFLNGAVVLALTMTGDLSLNPSAPDDDERTFNRPFTQREFRR